MKLHVPCLALLFHLHAITTHALPHFSGSAEIANINGDPFRSLLVRQNGEGSCDNSCRKKCRGKRIKDPTNCRRCIRCALGTKPDPSHTICIKDGDQDNNEEENRDCPKGEALDPKEGPQKPDAKPKKCAIDDTKDCKKPKVPETRPNGKENDANFKPKCLDVNENDKTKCDGKQQYMMVEAGPDGKANRRCKPTRQYEDKKKKRWEKMRYKFKKRWEEKKEERAKRNEERKERKNKVAEQKKTRDAEEQRKKEEIQKKKEKEDNDKRKKKIKSYKCAVATALMEGVYLARDKAQAKARLAKRVDPEVEGYMDMTSCYFSGDFVEDDEFLEYFPSDVNVDEIGEDIDDDLYMKAFNEQVDHMLMDIDSTHDYCSPCTRKKRHEGNATVPQEYEAMRKRAERAWRNISPASNKVKRQEALSPEDFCDMSGFGKREVGEVDSIQKRNPLALLFQIGLWAGRLGAMLLRGLRSLASFSPRLGNILKNTKNLFRLAPKGNAGTAGSRQAMKEAMKKLASSKTFRQCVKAGRP